MVEKILSSVIVFSRKQRYVLGLICIQLAVFHEWIFVNRTFTFGDVGVYTVESQKELISYALHIYSSTFGFGEMSITASTNPFLFAYGVLGKMGIGPIWSEKIILFYPIVFGVVLASYFLIRYLTKSQLGAFMGALVYSYNVYFLITLTGSLYLSWAYAVAPLVFLTFLKVLDIPDRLHQLAFVFSSAVLGFIEFRIFYVTAWMLAIYFSLFLYFKKASIRECLRYVGYFVLPGILFILINIFWVVPLLFSGSLSSNTFFSRGLFGNEYFDIVNAFVAFHPWWTWSVPSIFVKQAAPPALFIIPLLASSLLLIPRHRQRNGVYIFSVLFLTGVFLTKQSGAPFEEMYLWLYNHLPGFNAFREASKFYIVSSLALSVLIGYYLSYAREASQKTKIWQYFLRLSLAAVAIITFLNAKTIATENIQTMFIPRDVPPEYTRLDDFLLSQKDFSRVLWMPHTNRFGLFSDTHPAVSMLMNIDTTYADFSKGDEKKLEGHLYEPFTFERFYALLDKQSIRYVVVPSNLVWDEVSSPWRNPKNFTDKLKQVSFLKKISDASLEKHDIYVYENMFYRPHIYVTKEMETIQKNIPFEKVDFQSISPTEYTIHLNNVSNPLHLNFSDTYHPDWKLRLGSFRWFDILRDEKYFLSDANHFENDAKLNSFRIDPKVVCANMNDGCVKNTDGSYTISLTLYFKPQAYFSLGLFVSVTVFFGSFLWMMYYMVKRCKK